MSKPLMRLHILGAGGDETEGLSPLDVVRAIVVVVVVGTFNVVLIVGRPYDFTRRTEEDKNDKN